jgi:hypothetical protein
MDDFCNCRALARILKIMYETDCVGTLKMNRKIVLSKVKNTILKKGEMIA